MTDEAAMREADFVAWQKHKEKYVTNISHYEFRKIWQAAQSASVPQWQPIETAPKDGTWVLLYQGEHVFQGYWFNIIEGHERWADHSASGCGGYVEAMPTHWMPLPPAPKPQKDGE